MEPGSAIFTVVSFAVFLAALVAVSTSPSADRHLLWGGAIVTFSQLLSVALDDYNYPFWQTMAMDTISMAIMLLATIRRPAEWKITFVVSLIFEIGLHISRRDNPAEPDVLYRWMLNFLFIVQLVAVMVPATCALIRHHRRTKKAAPIETASIPFRR